MSTHSHISVHGRINLRGALRAKIFLWSPVDPHYGSFIIFPGIEKPNSALEPRWSGCYNYI